FSVETPRTSVSIHSRPRPEPAPQRPRMRSSTCSCDALLSEHGRSTGRQGVSALAEWKSDLRLSPNYCTAAGIDRQIRPRSGSQHRERIAQRSIGNLHETSEWMIEIEDQKHGSRDRGSADQQGDECGRVARRKQTEAHVEDGQPKNHDHQKWRRDRRTALRKKKPPRLAKTDRQRLRLCQKLSLTIGVRYQIID